jgi:hypothetical protein
MIRQGGIKGPFRLTSSHLRVSSPSVLSADVVDMPWERAK